MVSRLGLPFSLLLFPLCCPYDVFPARTLLSPGLTPCFLFLAYPGRPALQPPSCVGRCHPRACELCRSPCVVWPGCTGGAASAVRRLVHCVPCSAVPEPPRRLHCYLTRPPPSGGPHLRYGLTAGGPAVEVRLHGPAGHGVALRARLGFPSLMFLAHPVAAAPEPSVRRSDSFVTRADFLCRILLMAPRPPATPPGPHLAGPSAPATLPRPSCRASRLRPDWALCTSVLRA